MRLILRALGCVGVLIGCFLISATQRQPQEGRSSNARSSNVVPFTPTTFELVIDEEVAQQIAAALRPDSPASVRLSVRGLVMPAGWDFQSSIRVFVNKPDAKADTSADDPHFARAFGLSPLNPDDLQNIGIDLTPALSRLQNAKKWEPGQPVKITFVLVPSSPEAMPPTIEVMFRELVVSVLGTVE